MVSKHIVIDGNAFYEVDEDCLRRMGQQAGRGERGSSGKTAGMASGDVQTDQRCSGGKGRRRC